MKELSSSMMDPSKLKKEFDGCINSNKHLFVIFYMEGCGPCNAARPEWKKIKNFVGEKDFVCADIENIHVESLQNEKIKEKIAGFPAIMYIHGKNEIETYEESNVLNKDRGVASFVEWVNSKVKNTGGSRKKSKKRKHLKKKKHKTKTKKRKKRKKRLTKKVRFLLP